MAQKINFQNISIQNGLSHNNVNCIFQDSRGFLWIGTKEGLNRYDGYNILTYYSRKQDTTTLSNNFINAICEDPDSTGIWIGTKNGLNFLDFKQEKITRYKRINVCIKKFKSIVNIPSIIPASDGNIWIGTSKGLFKLKKNKSVKTSQLENAKICEIVPYTHEGDLPSKKISSLFHDKKGILWIGFASGDLYSLTREGEVSKLKNYKDFHGGTIRGIEEDEQGQLWIATERKGIVCLGRKKNEFVPFISEKVPGLESDSYNAICSANRGVIWLGSKNHGLVKATIGVQSISKGNTTNINIKHFKNDPKVVNSLIENTIRCLFVDRTGVLWAGTRGNGIEKITFQPNYFNYYKDIYSPKNLKVLMKINSIVEDRKGGFWIGSENGLCNFDRNANKYSYYRNRRGSSSSINFNDVFSICEDHNGKLWIGTNGGGLNCYNPEMNRFIHLTVENCNLSSNSISSLILLRSGDLLIATTKGGIHLVKSNELKKEIPKVIPFTLEMKSKKNDFLNSRKVVYQDHLGDIWITTNLDGVFRYNPKSKKLSHYNHDQGDSKSLPSDHITAVYEDQSGVIWLGSIKGLVRYERNTDEFKLYAMKDGLPDHSVIGIISDDDEYLWVLTRNWISRFDPKTERIRSFKIQHQVTDELFTHNPLWKTGEGEIFVGTQTEGCFSFFPDSIQDVSYLPQIAITDMKISGESMNVRQEGDSFILTQSINSVQYIELEHYQNNITFEFAALSYLMPERIQYACILKGAQQQWQYMNGNRRLVNYFNLSPGEYVFSIKASNCDGLWNNKGKSINIKVLPPWWETWWAYSLYIVVIISLFIALYRYTYEWINLKNRLVFEQMEKEKIWELNQAKLQFFTNISHEFRTPLTLIIGPLDRLLASRDDNNYIHKQYVLMHKNASRLLRLINQLMDFRKTENKQMKIHAGQWNISSFISEEMKSFEDLAQEKQICFDLNSQLKEIMLWFDFDKMDKIMFNLLSNAFKFTPKGGTISVDICLFNTSETDNLINGRVEIKVSDSGRGMTSERAEKIFDRFYQGEDDQTGTGIGLSLTRSLVELHKGEISVSSEKGIGSCFTVSLPLGKEHFQEHEIISHQSDLIEKQKVFSNKQIHDLNEKGIIDTVPELKQEKKVISGSVPIILIVEDNDSLRSFIRENLEQQYRVMEAENGQVAFAKVLKTTPDLIISDVMMPQMDGLQLCKKIKTDPRISHVPVILLTALDTVKDQLTGYKMGADDYIPKPFNIGLLDVRVKNLIQTRLDMKHRFRKDINIEPKDITIASADEKLLEKALKVIEANLSDPDFTVEKLGQEIGISRVHLYRKIKALTDQTATEFIRTIRLKQAAKLLVQKKLTVSEISFLVGFKNPISFSRSFKNHFGESPTDYVANNS